MVIKDIVNKVERVSGLFCFTWAMSGNLFVSKCSLTWHYPRSSIACGQSINLGRCNTVELKCV